MTVLCTSKCFGNCFWVQSTVILIANIETKIREVQSTETRIAFGRLFKKIEQIFILILNFICSKQI